jgi:hypothetical protein
LLGHRWVFADDYVLEMPRPRKLNRGFRRGSGRGARDRGTPDQETAMPRIVLSTLAAALMMSSIFVAPASSDDTLSSGSSSDQGGTYTITFNGGWGTGATAVDPSNPNVVYVGGSTRYSEPSTSTGWEKEQELKSGR